ncbi:MAG: hypothetical protein HZA78_01080 [Candidatus Schekmanbacteria bacterium]|nr:hypothetical protein [Candidatus Schekmanbacteria bacterium]
MNEVFVFGAGASTSLAFGLPLGNGLVWDYHLSCTSMKEIKNGVPDLTEDNERFADFRNFLILMGNTYPELKYLVREFDKRGSVMFTPFINRKQYFADDVLQKLQEQENQEGISLVKKLIFQHIYGVSVGKDKPYKNFIENVMLNKKDSIAIISFNFDCLLTDYFENSLENGIYFDYLLKFDQISIDGYKKYKNQIPLIKLHGSLDWGICGECKQTQLSFFREYSTECICGGTIEPYIFVPHQELDKRISLLWSRATEVLKNAQKVTIVGYSFPDYDQKSLELFKNSLSADVNLEIVDYCETNRNEEQEKLYLMKKYRKMFPHIKQDINIYLKGFKQYLNEYNN